MRPHRSGVPLTALLAAMLTPMRAGAATEARFHCDDGTVFTARFAGAPSAPGTATLRFADRAVLRLKQAPSADGGRYAGGGTEFWIKGRGGTLTRGTARTTCHAEP